MIVPSMTHAEMVADARKDFKAMRQMLDRPLIELRREHALNPAEPIVHMIPWRSPNKNNWLIVIRYAQSSVSTYCVAWFADEFDRLTALWTMPKGLAYFIDPLVIEQYGRRCCPQDPPIECLQSFVLENYLFAMQVEKPIDENRWSVSIGSEHGIGLGEWDTETDVVHFASYVDHRELIREERPTKGAVDIDGVYDLLMPDQRAALNDNARRTAGEGRESNAA